MTIFVVLVSTLLLIILFAGLNYDLVASENFDDKRRVTFKSQKRLLQSVPRLLSLDLENAITNVILTGDRP